MIRSIILTLLSISSVFSQETKSRIHAPGDWNTEKIFFPLEFAPEIDYEGFEEIRFAPGWSDASSDEFWTYHFSWFIEDGNRMSEDLLAETISIYFDGLSKAVLKEFSDDSIKATSLDKTLCLFVKTNHGFKGKIRMFDSFFTKDYVHLNVRVSESICLESNKQQISFDISPKRFDHEVWKLFELIEIAEVCE